jgi:hypothetical protein
LTDSPETPETAPPQQSSSLWDVSAFGTNKEPNPVNIGFLGSQAVAACAHKAANVIEKEANVIEKGANVIGRSLIKYVCISSIIESLPKSMRAFSEALCAFPDVVIVKALIHGTLLSRFTD